MLWLQRRSLQATLDGAALAGAQSVDLPTVYAGGAHGDLRLNATSARAAVRTYVAAVPSSKQLTSFRLTQVRIVDDDDHRAAAPRSRTRRSCPGSPAPA